MNSSKIDSSLPGPPARLGRFAETVRIFSDPIRYLGENFARYGPIFGTLTATLTTPPSPDYPGTICIFGPDLIREVSFDHDGFHRSAMSHRLYPGDGVTPRTEPLRRIMTGLAYQRGETHRAHRHLVLPALHKQKVTSYLPDIISETNDLMAEWRVGEIVDISHEMNKLILRISARSLFGPTDEHGRRLGLLIDQWVAFVMSVGHLFPYDIPGFPYRKWLDLSHEIENMTRQIIRDKRASGASDDSLLSRLIQAADDDGLGFSEEDLVGHISLMLWGSRDAVAAALTWSLFLISMHERVQESIVSELEALLSGQPPSVQQIAQLPMTEHALKESLRLLPPFPMLDRVAATDTEVAGYEVPQGTEFIMSIFHTHRMPEYYEEPAAYRPERWKKINPELFQFMPFGGGPRMCPGSNLAWQELITITAMLLTRFRFEIVDNAKIDRIVKLGLLPKQGMPMKVLVQDKEYSKSVKSIRGNLREMVSTLV